MRPLILRQAGWAGLCALIVSGCASANPKTSPIPAQVPAQNPPLAGNENGGGGTVTGSTFDNLEIVDVGLNEKVAILRVGSQLAENNLLSVFAGLKNKTAHRLVLEVETIYKDKAGNVLNDGSWIPVTLKPHEERDYRSASISEQAVDFLIRVRRPPTTP